MNEQSKGMKILYTLFLLAVTTSTVIALYDRFSTKEQGCNCNKKEHG